MPLGQIVLDGDDIYWLEGRPAEGGRTVIMKHASNGTLESVTPTGFSIRNRVHEYGGGAYTVSDGLIVFCNDADQRIYRQIPGEAPHPITPAGKHRRYADLVVDKNHDRVLCVCEIHDPDRKEPENQLVAVPLSAHADAEPLVLARGCDFYASPRLSADGSRLAWLSWNHPNMPWDGTDLWVSNLTPAGIPAQPQQMAGGEQESVFQPQWSPGNQLYFVSDRSGWWNLYRLSGADATPLQPMEAEFGLPQWVFGMSTYGFVDQDHLACAFTSAGKWRLAWLHLENNHLEILDLPLSEIDGVQAGPNGAVFLGGSPQTARSVMQVRQDTNRLNIIRTSLTAEIPADYISTPRAVSFPSSQGRTAHGLYYAPHNKDYQAPNAERPPLLVKSHGGPTAAAGSALNPGIQYWTSRGFAVLDINYGGSTGYGRAYRRQLDGKWGVVDVDDCEQGARWLAEQGLVDPDRMAIRGGSAGGYTTLCALTFRDTFHAGASHYGVSDLEALATDTHKFESRYLDRLVGPWPQARAIYRERSPIHFADHLNAPVIFFQGLEDRVVPPEQSRMMSESLREKGIAVAYVTFEGEQHGFRQAANIQRALDAEYYFYSRVFRFEPGDPVEAVAIDNLEAL